MGRLRTGELVPACGRLEGIIADMQEGARLEHAPIGMAASAEPVDNTPISSSTATICE